MSKQGKRKITVELPKAKDLSNRPSVFERLGTKKAAAAKKASEVCRQWAQHGTCPYGKTCKFATTHTLISPSKQRAAIKDNSTESKRVFAKDDPKSRLHSAVVVRSGSPEPSWETWDPKALECANADDLEKRRQQLQRELEIQLKMDSGKDPRKEKKKPPPSSSSSSRSSSTTSVSSSTSRSSSSSSSDRDARKKGRKNRSKRNSSSSSDSDTVSRKKRKTEVSKKPGGKGNVSNKDTGRVLKKTDTIDTKKNVPAKNVLSKKSLSPPKKAGGTPPISNKNMPKGYILSKNSKSPLKKDKNRSPSPQTLKEREREKERLREREREREKERERDRKRSKSPRSKGRSRSPRGHGSHPPRDPRRKESPARSRGSSPKGRSRQDDRHRSKTSPTKDDRKDDKRKDHKDRSPERRKDKHEEKDRHDRDRKERDHRTDRETQREKEREEALARCQERQRERERMKEQSKREQESKRVQSRARERDRGLNKGLEKPTPDKPVERLLPRPEERLAALAATNRNIGADRAISSNRDRSENRTDHNARKSDRPNERERLDRAPKRQNERRGSIDRMDRNEYDRNIDRSYDHSHSMDRGYDRANERYDDMAPIDRERDRSTGPFPAQGRERDLHYDSSYDIQGSHSRGYVETDERGYDEHLDDHHNIDRDRRNTGRRDERPWEEREASVDPDRQYMHHGHPHKEWDNEEFRGDWNRQDRHWQHRDGHQVHDWGGDKDMEMESWHSHRQPAGSGGPARNRMHEFRGRMDQNVHGLQSKRNMSTEDSKKPSVSLPAATSTGPPLDTEETPIPDNLSEFSDDPDEILNRDDMVEHDVEKGSVKQTPPRDSASHAATTNPAESNEKELNSTPLIENKNESTQDQNPADDALDNLDFEEISDGELEEDQRVKGLGDALGVDWASLVAEVRNGKAKDTQENGGKEKTGARQYWEPQKVLARIGVSVYMAGEKMVNEIFGSNNQPIKTEDGLPPTEKKEEDFKLSHPIASIQVALERKKKQHLALFGAGTGFTRALCARQDLALRRHLCNLPMSDYGTEVHPPDPQLFAMAQKLIQKSK